MARATTHRTKTDLALEIIRERILSGEFAPGDALRTEALAEDLGMSATPVREALRLLQSDRLVDYKPHQGILVAGISPSEMEEIYTLRAQLEPLAVERGAAAVKEHRLDRLEEIHQKLVKQARLPKGKRDIGSLNAEWHWAVYEACEMTYLLDFIGKLWERFPWRTMWARPADLKRSIREHDEIMEAIRSGDPAEAARLMRDHVLTGVESLVPGRHDRDGSG